MLQERPSSPLKRILADDISGRGCLFLDRDGVINERQAGGYVTTWSDFTFRPTAIDAMRIAADGFPLIIVTNQRCISLGIATAADVARLMDRMCAQLSEYGIQVAAWYACPHDLADQCECRKPRPGMLLQAAADMQIDIASSFIIGDSHTDVAAGKAAGCKRSILCDSSDADALVRAIKTLTNHEEAYAR